MTPEIISAIVGLAISLPPLWWVISLNRAVSQRQRAMDSLCALFEKRLIGIEDFKAAAGALINGSVDRHTFRLMTFRDPWKGYPEQMRKLIAWGAP